MITSDKMRDIIVRRSLQIMPVRDNLTGAVKWLCRTIEGSRAAPSNTPYLTPEDAVEAAEARFSQAEQRERESKAEEILKSLEKGDYFAKPRDIPSTDPDGEPIIRRVFDIFDSQGNLIAGDRPSLSEAIVEVEKERKRDKEEKDIADKRSNL